MAELASGVRRAEGGLELAQQPASHIIGEPASERTGLPERLKVLGAPRNGLGRLFARSGPETGSLRRPVAVRPAVGRLLHREGSMNRFMKVVGLMAGLLGLGVAGAEFTTVTWDTPAGEVAGVVVGAAADAFALAPLVPGRVAGPRAHWSAGGFETGVNPDGFNVRDNECGLCDPQECWELEPPETGHVAAAAELGSRDRQDGWHPSQCFPGDCQDKHPYSCHCVCRGSPDYEACMQACEGGGGGGHGSPDEAVQFLGEHGTATLFREDLPRVWAAIGSGSIAAEEIASAYWNVEVNHRRGALQVIGCSGAVVGHLDLVRVADQ